MGLATLHYFPRICLDETLHSVLSRLHRLSGNRYARQTLDEVFGTHLIVATSFLPSHLGDLRMRLPEAAEGVLEHLIEEATLLPYFRPFLTPAQTHLCYEAMAGRSAGAVKVGIGAVASGVGGRNYFRFCEECRREDEAAVGCAYWHRSHCLPGVWICHLHHLPLYVLPATYVETRRHSFFLPDEMRIDQCCSQQVISNWEEHLLLAKSSHDLLLARLRPISRTTLQGLYRGRAQELQLADRHGRISVSAVLSAAARFRAAFLENDDLAFLACEEWPIRLLRKHRSSSHPVKHLGLMQMLNISIAELCIAAEAPQVPGSSSPKPFAGPLNESSQDNERRRERFLAAALTPASFRKAPDYIWLYRHDRQWLKEVLADHKSSIARNLTRIDWASRDALLAKQIRAIAQELVLANDSPRLSAAYLARQTGKSAAIEKFAKKLPLTRAALQESAESINAFRCRRLKRVVLHLHEAGVPLIRWQILKRVGLKEPLSVEVEEVLQMYVRQAQDGILACK
jgi:hypothetical protein